MRDPNTEIKALQLALARLASSNAFETPRVMDPKRDAELIQRMSFAQAELEASQERYDLGFMDSLIAGYENQIDHVRDTLTAVVTDLTEDAERWRALMRCGRIKMQGSAGVDPHTLQRRNGSNIHFGAEFWPEPLPQSYRDEHPESAAHEDKSTAWGLACLKAMADQLREMGVLLQPSICVLCGTTNADPRPWDPREPVCPRCQDRGAARTTR